MATQWQKAVKTAVANSTGVMADKVTCHKNGTVTVTRNFFFNQGQDATTWANTVKQGCTEAGTPVVVVDAETHNNEWPKDSFFSARVAEPGTAEEVWWMQG